MVILHWQFAPQNQTHVLGDHEVTRYHAFGIPERGKKPNIGPLSGAVTQGWFFENVKVGEDQVSIT